MAEVRLEVDLAHPPDRVWRALTTAQLVGAWFMPTDLEPREGSRFTLDPGTLAGFLGLVSGELLEVVAEQRLVMLWQGEKLHTRVVWDLTATAAGGCRVQVVQTGFIGAPAALRRRALRDTYVRLFAEQLPALLDRLATGTGDLSPRSGQRSGPGRSPAGPTGGGVAGVPGPAVPLRSAAPPGAVRSGGGGRRRPTGEPPPPPSARAGVPRQRRPGGNMAVAAWSAGRTIGPAAVSAPTAAAAAPAAATGRSAAGPAHQDPAGQDLAHRDPANRDPANRDPANRDPANRDPANRDPAGQEVGFGLVQPRRPAGGGQAKGSRGRRAPPAGWWRVVPAWIRAVAIGAAAAVLALAVLTAVSRSAPAGDVGLGDRPGGPDAPPGAPGIALQPGAATSRTGPGGQPAPGTPDLAPGAVTAGSGGGAEQVEPAPVRPFESTRSSGSAAPVLTARLVTSGLPVLGGRAVAVTVSNPGPAVATGWVVSMDVGDQAVTDVSGAAYQPDGPVVVFTPLADELPAGEHVVFSFHLTAPVLGLLGGADPTGCIVNGQPCG